MIRLIIADDHLIVREGLKRVFGDVPGIEAIGEAASVGELMRELERGYYNLVMLDIAMPDVDGLSALRGLREDHPGVPVIVFTMHSEEQYAIQAFRLGASGYITKDRGPEELIDAVRKVHAGEKYVTATLVEALISTVDGSRPALPHERLSRRELQVMRLIAQGRRVGEIAEDLSLSVKTVSTYRSRILEKMEMGSSAEIIHYAVSHGLV